MTMESETPISKMPNLSTSLMPVDRMVTMKRIGNVTLWASDLMQVAIMFFVSCAVSFS